MDWFNDLGNMYALMPDSPALAFDFALNGANPDLVGYGLAYGLQATPTPIDVYPPDEAPLSQSEAAGIDGGTDLGAF